MLRKTINSLASAVLFVCVLIPVAPAAPVAAATFTVNTDADTVDAVCDVAHCSLREAILAANTSPGDDTITVPVGVFQLRLSGGENVGTLGDLDITGNVTITGAGAANTIIDAGLLSPRDRVIHILPGVTVSITGVTIRNGYANSGQDEGGCIRNEGALTLTSVLVTGCRDDDGGGGIKNRAGATLILDQTTVSNGQAPNGGGLDNEGGTVTIRNGSVITGNTSTRDGGGIQHVVGQMTIQNSTVSSNTSTAEDGGGIHVGYDNNVAQASRLDMDGVTLTANRTISGGGAGMSVETAEPSKFATVTIINSVITNNVGNDPGHDGGGLNFDGGYVTITNTQITGNTNGRGGGMQSTDGANVTMDRVTLSNNTAPTDGGGMHFGQGTLTMTNSLVSNNTSNEEGGGLELGGAGPRGQGLNVTLTNVTITGNTAANGGGGISAAANGLTTVTGTNLTVFNNGAASGGNVFVDDNGPGTVRFRNTIVANSQRGPNCTVVPGSISAIASLGNNLDSAATCGFGASGDLQNTNPQLQPLADNTGITQTHALLATSPAVDRGTNTGCPTTDQRAIVRPADGNGDGSAICDIGAFELASTPPPPCNPRPNVSLQTSNAGGGRLRVVVTANRDNNAPSNTIRSIRFSAPANVVQNALIDINGQTGRSGAFTVTFTNNPQTVEFFIRRAGAGPTTVPFVVVDHCGDWQTFAGAGAGTF